MLNLEIKSAKGLLARGFSSSLNLEHTLFRSLKIESSLNLRPPHWYKVEPLSLSRSGMNKYPFFYLHYLFVYYKSILPILSHVSIPSSQVLIDNSSIALVYFFLLS